MIDISLDDAQVKIIQSMFRLIDNMPVCPDELLDCDMDDYNDLSQVFGEGE